MLRGDCGNIRRSAFTETARVEVAPPARARGAQPAVPGVRVPVRAQPDEADDDCDDPFAMRDEPACEREGEEGDDGRARDRDAEPEQDRSAERVAQVVDRSTGGASVDQLHDRNDDRCEYRGAGGEGEARLPGKCRRDQQQAVRRSELAAPAQGAHSDSEGDDDGGDGEHFSRSVRHVVVGVVRERVVADDVDGIVREGRRRSDGRQKECPERAVGGAHGVAVRVEAGLPLASREAKKRFAGRRSARCRASPAGGRPPGRGARPNRSAGPLLRVPSSVR